MNKERLLILLLSFNVLVFAILSCGGSSKETGGKDTLSDSSQVENDSIVADKSPITPKKCVFYMDASVSMKGYFDTGDSRLLGVITSYLNLTDEPSIYLYGKTEGNPLSKKNWLDLEGKNAFAWSGESDLKSMLETMAKRSSDADVCFLLTDGILSGSNQQISKNRKYNIQMREAMAEEIKKIFKDNKSLTALVVRYKANFKGKYSCYNNNSKVINGKERPYYIIAIGKWEYVKHIEELVRNSKLKTYDSYVLFGDEPTYSKIDFSWNSGIKGKDKDLLIIKSGVKKDGDVVLSSDISFLPEYMRTVEYWNENLELNVHEKAKTPILLDKNQYDISIENNSSKIKLSIRAHKLVGRELDIKLKYAVPTWINDYTDENDLDIDSNPSKLHKTFNLKYFVGGFEAIQINEYIKKQTLKFK